MLSSSDGNRSWFMCVMLTTVVVYSFKTGFTDADCIYDQHKYFFKSWDFHFLLSSSFVFFNTIFFSILVNIYLYILTE